MNDDQKKYLYYAIPIVVVIALGGALYYGKRHKEETVATQTATQAPADTTANESPEHHPIEAQPAAELPPLGESDPTVEQSLSQVFGPNLDRYLVPKDIVRHFVVTIDNLPRKKNAVQMWPVKPLGGELKTSTGNELTLNEANYERYKPLVKLATTADTKQLVAMYKRFYPLFQQAYVDLGYPEGYFNNRLVEVIDHLLETPEVEGQVKLVQPGVFYEFADPSLESRSSGQKLLMRMGRDNAAAVKLKLRELRREIAQREQ
jgi:Protein of unknown function (DUF3014)